MKCPKHGCQMTKVLPMNGPEAIVCPECLQEASVMESDCRKSFEDESDNIRDRVAKQPIERIASGEEWAWQGWKACWDRFNHKVK